MPKLYCAKCGTELHSQIKAIPNQAVTITVIVPHSCPKEIPEFPWKVEEGEVIPAFTKKKENVDKFEFVKKINDLNKKSKIDLDEDTGDLRPDSDKIHTSIAPKNLLDSIKINKI